MHFSLPNITIPPQVALGIRTLIIVAILSSGVLSLSITAFAALTGPGREPCPNEEPITVPGVEKKLIRMGPSRTGDCVTPVSIIMHNTAGGTLDSNWQLFDQNERGGGQNAGFIIGEDGHTYQTVEFYQKQAELTWTSNYVNNYAVSIEMVGPYVHEGKESQPPDQYNAALNLVCFLMKQYNIPLGTTEADWTSSTLSIDDPLLVPGIYGHYQITPGEKEDPGQGWLADFREDLRSGNCGSAANSGGTGGRMVPYDAYARPYSWPITGTIRQDYGYTDEAQNLGARFPGLYPYGNPGTIFSKDNHDEQPTDPGTAKYINPNIDVSPPSGSNQARAVYATHAGWLTFADWAGPEKGYTIQIESDVEGDGQADLGTRYMRLQAPQDGFFAPNIPITRMIVNNSSSVGMSGNCTDGPGDEWAKVNRWNKEIMVAIAEAKKTENVDVPCNLVKAFMRLESGGEEIPPNMSGYHGLMQVADGSVPGGGSDCDWQTYDLNTTQGNVNCGVQEIARGYIACDGKWDAAMSRYLSGNCDKYRDVSDGFGTTPLMYSNKVMEYWKELDSYGSGSTVISSLPATNPTTENPEETETFSPPPFVVEGENMKPAQPNQGAEVVYDDASASGGASMKLTSNVRIDRNVSEKADQLMIRAKSIKNLACLNQVDPEVEVYITNQLVGTITVNSTIFQTYPIPVEGLDGSDHILSLRLANPGVLLCDRAVWIDSISYIITNPNTPTVETVSTVNIEAEDIPDATEGDKPTTIHEDKFASEGKYVAFTSNSKLEGEFDLPEANYFSIRARADICSDDGNPESGYPILKISIDDKEFMTLGVSSQDWTEYSYKFLPGQTIANATTTGSTTSPPSTSTPPSSTDGSATNGDGTGGAPTPTPGTPGSPSVGDGTGGAPLNPVQPGSPSVGDGTGGASTPTPPSGNGGESNVQGEKIDGGNVLQAVDDGGSGAIDSEDDEGDEKDKTYKITIEFVNDKFIAGVCDRNVYVDVLRFEEFAVTQAVYSKVSVIGKTTYVAYNQLIGYVSSSRGSDEEFEAYQQFDVPAKSEDSDDDAEPAVPIEQEEGSETIDSSEDQEFTEEELADLHQKFISRVPNANQLYLSYRIMYNNPNFTTFPLPIERDRFINAEVDNPYIIETDDNTVAGSLKTIFDRPDAPMYFFCGLRQKGDNVKCIQEPNP